MKKRFLAVFLALALCVGLAPTTAFAGGAEKYDNEHSYGDVLYAIDDEKSRIVIVGCRNVSKLEIPSSIDGLPVTRIAGNAFIFEEQLTTIVIPDSVAEIGYNAFGGVSGGHSNLVSIIGGSGVTEVEYGAFAGTAWQANQGDFAILNGILIAYQGNGGAVSIPDGVTRINDRAFLNCSSVTSVSIPNSVTKIDPRAFYGCTMENVTISGSIINIDKDMFDGCKTLTNVDIQFGVTSIGNEAFRNFEKLTTVNIPSSVTSIGTSAFARCKALASVTIGSSVTSIGAYVFSDCEALTSVTIPVNVTSIDEYAFWDCTGLIDVYYGGTEEQWNAIVIGNGNFRLKNATIHHNSARAKFTDMKSNGFYVDAVEWAVANGVTTGKTATTFAPDENCTHGQILTFLWRAAGEPESSAQAPIALKGNEYYAGAVRWAAEKGMIDKNFNPNAACNRAYAVQYIWQAFGKPAPAKASPFTDVPAHWSSATAAAWAAEQGITTGTTATTFNPNGICNRGQIVTFLYRAYRV